jgi:phosphonatase-like hydrolase
MKPIRLVIFDIAGTIVEDRGEVLACFAEALKSNGVTVAADELREWKGASKREVVRHFVERQSGGQAFDVSQVDRTYRDFCRLLEESYRKGVAAVPGAEASFEWLRAHQIRIATTTGFPREISRMILSAAGWEKTFDAKVSSDDVRLGRPAPFMIFRAMEATEVMDVSQVVTVGDTPLDLQAGSNAGVRGVVGVLTGTHGLARLSQEPHTHIVSSVAEIPALLERAFLLG